ncbi:MAG: hypothetical protein EP350_03460 [Alphaproteobacteria bacterium]|nr:MAG: hypothetical protein EP350_03460 [Alphaproteobacteria bacterium]
MAEDPVDKIEAANAGLRQAMAVQILPVPDIEGELIYRDGHLCMARDRFWFETPGGIRFHYRKDGGVIVELPDEALRGEFELYLWGTVYGAVAWYNGLVPLHASSVSRNDRVIAFTADSGGGKSTLAAGLIDYGYDHVCDDTLIVLPVQGSPPVCLPDKRPMKLWSDALKQLAVAPLGPVATVPDKHYGQARRSETRVLPLGDLIFLEIGKEFALIPVTGATKLNMLPQAMYRSFIHAARGNHGFHADIMLKLASEVRFWRLTRPRESATVAKACERTSQILQAAGL